MSVVFSPKLGDYCLINAVASAPPPTVHPAAANSSDAMTAVTPAPRDDMDKITQLMGNTSMHPRRQVDNALFINDDLPSEESDDEIAWGGRDVISGMYLDDDAIKDFTACSADHCGYCGHCDY